MKSGNWDWEKSGPLRVAEVDKQLVSLDNRRLLAAQEALLEKVPIEKIDLDSEMPEGGTYRRNLEKKLNSRPPKRRDLPKVKLPPSGRSQKPQIVSSTSPCNNNLRKK